LTERGNDVILLGSSYMCLLRVLFSRGDMSAATKIIREVQRSTPAQDFSPWILNQLAAWQARIWVAQGKLSSASQWADTSGIEIDEELAPVHDFDYVVLARLLIAQGRLDEASRLLQRLLEAADAGGRTSKTIEILALQALASQAAGDSSQAMAALERGLSLAEPQGFVRTFVDEGPPMARLLYEATIAGTTAEYARRLLSAFTVAEQEHADTLERQAPQTQLVEPLSARELEVLELIAEGLTNPEVASRLYLSLNTIKAHTRNIYGKLSVHSRTQAIARSRALGILPRA
jgi:LuxR family maltose regulon positive regulatory protein